MNDWMRNVRRPTSYRVGNTRFSIKPQFQVLIMAVCALIIFIFIMLVFTTDTPKIKVNDINQRLINLNHLADYNDTYPLSATKMGADYKEYRIAMIADLDTDSKRDNGKYVSYVQYATLYVYDNLKLARLFVDAEPHELHSQYSYGDRGMELSELIVFNGRLYTCDDRTGIVFELNVSANKVTPWVILIDGDGVSTNKGFKCEWMAVKNNQLHVGSLGKEWTTTTGELVNHNPQWIKVINHRGHVEHVDWTSNYDKMRAITGYTYPGYMIFESGVWSDYLNKWYFLPRRASREKYDEKLDERRATNILIEADENFTNIKHRTIGTANQVRGYSSFKFIPDLSSDSIIVSIKSEEDSGKISTYLSVFNAQSGYVLLKDTLVSDKFKYEGIEFI